MIQKTNSRRSIPFLKHAAPTPSNLTTSSTSVQQLEDQLNSDRAAVMPFTCGAESAISILPSPCMPGLARSTNILVASATNGQAGYALITPLIPDVLTIEIAAEPGGLYRLPTADVNDMIHVRVITSTCMIDTNFSSLPLRTVQVWGGRYQVAKVNLETEISASARHRTIGTQGMSVQRVMVYLDSSMAPPGLLDLVSPVAFLGAIVLTDVHGKRFVPGQFVPSTFACDQHTSNSLVAR